MLGAFITFLLLFGLVKIFERGRDDLDNFQIGMVAVVPILCSIVVQVVLGFLYPDPTLILILPLLVLIGMTFFLLWKNLEISKGRSGAYTAAVVLVNFGLGFLLASG